MPSDKMLIIIELIILGILIVLNVWISVRKKRHDAMKESEEIIKKEKELKRKLDNPRRMM